MEKGLIEVYCGDGKGKTTAATGLAVRAAGCGMRVLFVRFLKNEHSGELVVLDKIPEIDVIHLNREFGFVFRMTEAEKQEAKEVYSHLWREAVRRAVAEDYDMLVADEFMAAYGYEFIEHEHALEFLKNKPEKLEVVLTGRNPAPEIQKLADYISEVKKIKHPFEQGIPARRGIEF